MGWKPQVLGRLLRALGLRDGHEDGDGLGQVAPAVDLLQGLDKDALAGGQQAKLVKIEVVAPCAPVLERLRATRTHGVTRPAKLTELDHPGDPITGYSLPRGYIVEYDRPVLYAVRSHAITTVSWPASASGWWLETTPALSGDSLVWNTVPAAEYQTNATSGFIVTSKLTGNAFYRPQY